MTKPGLQITSATTQEGLPSRSEITKVIPTNNDFENLHSRIKTQLEARNINRVRDSVARTYGADQSSYGRIRANNFRIAEERISDSMVRLIDPEAELPLKIEAIVMLAEALSNMTNHYYLGYQIERGVGEGLRIAASHDTSKCFLTIQSFMKNYAAAFSEEDSKKIDSLAAEERNRRLSHGVTERGERAIE